MEFQTFIKMQCMYSMNRCHFQCYGSLSSHIPFFPAFSFVIQALFSKMQSSRSLHFLVILKSTESMGYFRKEMNFLLIVHFRHFCSSYYFLCFFFFLHTEFRLQKRFKCSHICFPFGSLDVSFCACYSYLVGGSS